MLAKKLLIFLSLLIFFITGCVSSPKNDNVTTNSTTKTEIKKEPFKFNKDQLEFLKSLGINEVLALEDYGHYKLFWYDGEQFEVYINDKNGITEVKNGKKYPFETLWNDKQGKIGMRRNERVAYLHEFIKNANKRYDQAQQITWIDTTNAYKSGHKGLFTYMGLNGKDINGEKWLRVILHYSAYDWVFFKKVTFSNANEAWTYVIPNPYKIKQDVAYGGEIHEIYDAPLTDVRIGLEILAKGNNARIDFIGDHYRDGRNLNEYAIQNIKTYLLLQSAIDSE